MRSMSSIPLFVLGSAMLCSMAGIAQQVAPTVRIVNRIDERNLVTLKGNTLPVANAKNDRGRVSSDLPMNDLVLVLSRSAQQQAAFDKFVASQYEVGSANYHQWLEPEEVGAKFGPAQSDIDTVSAWLSGHGFSVGELSKDRLSLRFSGTAAQVQSAFHTEIHHIEVGGVQHIANMSDPRIPAALSPAVVGIKSLHNFFPRPMHRLGSQVELNRTTGKWQRIASPASDGTKTQTAARRIRPQFGTTDSSSDVIEDVAPYDFATIYNVKPLWTASTPITGSGQTIAIAGTSRLEGTATDATDVDKFRSTFGLPAIPSFNTIVGNSYDPGICTSSTNACGIGDLTENSLDVEWAGAVATGADIVLVASGYNSQTNPTNDAVYDSASYIVNQKVGNILNLSYGQCELFEGTAGNVLYYNLWQLAASEGISVVVSSGDSGSAACDQGQDSNGTPYAAEWGLSVSGLASSPYNTAVGGTDFNWCPASNITSGTACTASPYWNSSNGTGQASAKGYVPEIPWNDSCASQTGIALAQYAANLLNQNGYSVSKPTTAEAACNFFVNYSGDFSGDITVYVNTVGGGGGQSNCVSNNTTSTTADTTSCGTPATVTVTNPGGATATVTLVNGGWPKPSWQANSSITGYVNDGVRDIPDVSFFAADGLNNSAYLMCVSADSNPCTYTGYADKDPLYAQEVGGTSVASPAMAGVMALINQKAGSAQGLANPILYALAAKQSYSSCSAETVTTSSSCYFNDIDKYTIDQPCDYGDFGYQSPDCTAVTSGDGIGILANATASLGGYTAVKGYDLATGLGSLNVANVVNGWTAAAPGFALSNSGAISVAGGATTGNTSTISVTPSSGFTGTVALTCTMTTNAATSPATCTLSPTSVDITGTSALPSTLTVTTTASTTPGTYTAKVSGVSGSTTETTSVTVTVTSTTSSGSFALSNSGAITVNPGATSGNTSTITVTPSDGFTGSVALTCAITPTAASDPATCSLSPASVSITDTTAKTSTLTVSTTAASSALNRTNKLFWPSAGGTALALVFLFGIPRRRRNWLAMVGLLVLVISVAGMGCGGSTPSGGGNPGTTAGTYTVTVTGTSTSPSLTKTTSVTLTVN